MNDDVVEIKKFGKTIVKFSNRDFVCTEQEKVEILKQFKKIGYKNLKNLNSDLDELQKNIISEKH